MISYGTKKHHDIHTFLRPIYDELMELSTNGIQVKVGDEVVKSRIHSLVFTGDIPAVADLANHSGHMSLYGCRMCDVKGLSKFFGSTHGMYFPRPTSTSNIYSREIYSQQSGPVRKYF
jgi:hypothetical protein